MRNFAGGNVADEFDWFTTSSQILECGDGFTDETQMDYLIFHGFTEPETGSKEVTTAPSLKKTELAKLQGCEKMLVTVPDSKWGKCATPRDRPSLTHTSHEDNKTSRMNLICS